MTNRRIHLAITQAILAATFSLSLFSPTYADTLIQTSNPGTNGNNATTDAGNGTNASAGPGIQATFVSSDPSNTVNITGGAGGNGGNGAPTTSAPQAGNAGAGANGGNATLSATLSPTSNSISTLTAIGGNGGQAGLPGPAGTSSSAGNPSTSGNGGNASITLAPLSTSPQLFTANITVQGGNGGDAQGAGALSGNGGTASISNLPLFPANTDVNLTLNQIGGNAGIATNGATEGNGASSNLTIETSTAFANSIGNITYSQNAVGGNGSTSGNGGSGNATSVFIVSVSSFSGQSLNASVSAIAGTGANKSFAFISISGGTNPIANAYAAGPNASAMADASQTALAPFAPAQATATSVTIPSAGHPLLGNAVASVDTINPIFHGTLIATGGSNGTQTAFALLNNGPLSFANGTPQAAISAIFTPIAPNTGGPINNPLVNLQFLLSNSATAGSQTHTDIIQGILIPTKLIPEELTLSLSTLSLPSNFNNLTFNITLQGLTTLTINQSFTNYTDAAAYFNQTLDLGPLTSFGTSQINITANLTLTTDTPGENFEIAANLANTVPEPASLSLLAATLPLLLKRRRRPSPPPTRHSNIQI